MFPYFDLHESLRCAVVDTLLFDNYRLVDVETHMVYSYSKDAGELSCSFETCHHIWSRQKPCANCTSRACLERHEEVIKIEQLGDRVLLIISLPVILDGRGFALELIKDVTSSLMIPDYEAHDNVEITQVIGRLNELAVRDSFTTLYNKTFISNQLQNMIDETAYSDTHPAVLIALDIDYFKQINDNHGHNVGDDVLLYLSNHLKAAAQSFEHGWAGRSGGDEFVVCIPHGLDDAGLERFQSVIDEVERRQFEGSDGSFTITVSYGVAHLNPDDTPRSLMERADNAMYAVKHERHSERGRTTG